MFLLQKKVIAVAAVKAFLSATVTTQTNALLLGPARGRNKIVNRSASKPTACPKQLPETENLSDADDLAAAIAASKALEKKEDEDAIARAIAEVEAFKKKEDEDAIAASEALEKKEDEDAIARAIAEVEALEKKEDEDAIARAIAEVEAELSDDDAPAIGDEDAESSESEGAISAYDWVMTRHRYADALLRNYGKKRVPNSGEGDCFFRALSQQKYGSEANHMKMRKEIVAFMSLPVNKAELAAFLQMNVDGYLNQMKRQGEFADGNVLHYAAKYYKKNIRVFEFSNPTHQGGRSLRDGRGAALVPDSSYRNTVTFPDDVPSYPEADTIELVNYSHVHYELVRAL